MEMFSLCKFLRSNNDSKETELPAESSSNSHKRDSSIRIDFGKTIIRIFKYNKKDCIKHLDDSFN